MTGRGIKEPAYYIRYKNNKMYQRDQYKLYSITEAAREMHLGKDAVYRLIKEGKIGIIKIGKRVKIPAAEIMMFLQINVKKNKYETNSIKRPFPETHKSKSKTMFLAIREETLNGKCL